MAGSTATGLRFFGVIDADDVRRRELETQGVTLVAFRDLAAVVQAAPYVRATPGDDDLNEYVRIVDAMAEHGPVVPAPVGTIFRNESVLARWLEIHYATLHEALGVVERRGGSGAPYDFVRMELGA